MGWVAAGRLPGRRAGVANVGSMQGTRMVPLTRVASEFAGRVLVAKLGSAGIIAELRGISPVYPVVLEDPVVWVEASELSEARELITVDADDVLEAGPEQPGPAHRAGGPVRSVRPLLALVALVVLASFVVGIRGCGATSSGPVSAHVR